MERIRWANPVQILLGANVTLPVTAPRLCTVVSASITRLSTGLADHLAAAVILGVVDHPMANVALGVTQHLPAAVIAALTTHLAADVAAAVVLHTDDAVVDAILDHPVHSHPLLIQAVVSGEDFGASGVGSNDIQSATGQTIVGAGGTGGVQNNAAVQAHAVGANPLVHTATPLAHVVSATDVAHVAGNPMVHGNGIAVPHLGASPVVGANATKVDADTVTLDVNLNAGDLLTLVYTEVGHLISVS